jgi:hypothetical protein
MIVICFIIGKVLGWGTLNIPKMSGEQFGLILGMSPTLKLYLHFDHKFSFANVSRGTHYDVDCIILPSFLVIKDVPHILHYKTLIKKSLII